MNARCSTAFAASHVCHYAEYELSTSAATVPAQGAWLDASCIEHAAGGSEQSGALVCGDTLASTDSGREIFQDGDGCRNWTSAGSLDQGFAIQPGGGTSLACNVARPIACCNTPYHERFRGFTTAHVTGANGGRAAMHQLCAQQFSGSHLCHLAEYAHAGATTSPPASGAWLDASTFNDQDDTLGAMPRSGRNTRPGFGCLNWTSSNNLELGKTITPGGDVDQSCSVARPLSCCQ